MTVRKKEGGMGFKDFAIMNSALLAKQVWRMMHHPEALWVQVLTSPNSDFICAEKGRSSSWAWASLLHGRDIIRSLGRWVIGDGSRIDVKADLWMHNGQRAVLKTNSSISIVAELIDQSNQRWDMGKIRENFELRDAVPVLQTPISMFPRPDVLIWPYTKDGGYSVKSRYAEIKKKEMNFLDCPSTSDNSSQGLWKRIWSIKVPQKIKMFMWKISHNILPVKENLWRRRIARSGNCPICNEEAESAEHALLYCAWTRPVWFGSQMQRVPDRESGQSLVQWINSMFEGLRKFLIIEFSLKLLYVAFYGIYGKKEIGWFSTVNPLIQLLLYSRLILCRWITYPMRKNYRIQIIEGYNQGFSITGGDHLQQVFTRST